MQFEYEIRLKDGRLVNVVGEAEVIHACDCCEGRDHVEAIDIESAVLIVNDGADQWLEIEHGGRVGSEIESKVESLLYSELAGVA